MNLKTRLGAAAAVAVLATSLAAVEGTPAMAADGGQCAANAFCLYQWTKEGSPVAGKRWQTSYANILLNPETPEGYSFCLNIPPAKWYSPPDDVSDNSASLEYYTNDHQWDAYVMYAYNWVNCNRSGQYTTIGQTNATARRDIDDLNTKTYQYPAGNGVSLYHTITSIEMVCTSVAAGCFG